MEGGGRERKQVRGQDEDESWEERKKEHEKAEMGGNSDEEKENGMMQCYEMRRKTRGERDEDVFPHTLTSSCLARLINFTHT